MDIGKKLIEAMEDFADRLEVAGGHIEATGLRSTTYKHCWHVPGTVAECPLCHGTGYIRTVNDGTGKSN